MNRFFILCLGGVFLAFFDLMLKDFLTRTLGSEKWSIFGDILTLHIVYNPGIAFSLPIRGIFLQMITWILISGMVYYVYRDKSQLKNPLHFIAFLYIFWGAFAHGYERIRYGQVVDYIDLKYFAIFNFADILLTIGAVVLLLHSVFPHGFSRK